jgi:hypothetical protein
MNKIIIIIGVAILAITMYFLFFERDLPGTYRFITPENEKVYVLIKENTIKIIDKDGPSMYLSFNNSQHNYRGSIIYSLSETDSFTFYKTDSILVLMNKNGDKKKFEKISNDVLTKEEADKIK